MVLGHSRDTRNVKIYARGKGPAGAFEYDLESWGTGGQVVTTLVNPSGEVSYFSILYK